LVKYYQFTGPENYIFVTCKATIYQITTSLKGYLYLGAYCSCTNLFDYMLACYYRKRLYIHLLLVLDSLVRITRFLGFQSMMLLVCDWDWCFEI